MDYNYLLRYRSRIENSGVDIFNYKNIDFIAFEPLDPKTRVPKLDKINNYVLMIVLFIM